MEIRQVQELKQLQRLVLTPQLQIAIRLLQLSKLELVDEVRSQLESNPALDEDIEGSETISFDEAAREVPGSEELAEPGIGARPDFHEDGDRGAERAEVDWEKFVEGYHKFGTGPTIRVSNEEFPSVEATVSSRNTLAEHLLWQIRLADLDARSREIGAYIVGNLNDDGYLVDLTPDEIAANFGIDVEEVEAVRRRIQELDPVGCAARDLRECLLIQARVHHPDNVRLLRLIDVHLHDLERKNLPAIARALKGSLADVRELVETIRRMDPKPGRGFSSEDPIYIQPDVYVIKVGGEYVTVLNEDGLPKLRISQYYEQALAGHENRETREFVQEKLRSAMWLIRSIHQRQSTIRRVTESIMRFQRDFLDRGVSHLRPLVLRDVADDVGMHESTISRVTTNKYVHTPQGIFELKYFFNSHVGSLTGEDHAAEAVKSRIKALVKAEAPGRPLSDQQIADILRKENIVIARRTVAKYREALGVLPSSRRKPM